jgi:hypothetical protein
MKHGLDCQCDECKQIKKFLRDGVKAGRIYLAGLPEDKKRIMEDK